MTSKTYLLDANVLIALATPEHSLNTRAAAWFREGPRFATCPITHASYLDLPIERVLGHRQVTDAYLVLLAKKHGGAVATLDEALAAFHSQALLIP
jgi:hypothetical protein